MTEVIDISKMRGWRTDKERCLNQLASIPYYIKLGGEVLTKDEHLERERKKEAVERAAKDRL